MATPGRKTRTRRNKSDEPEAAGLGATPALLPSTAGIELRQASPRRSARHGSPAKQSQQALPELSSRTSTAYGTQGRTAMSESIETNQNAALLLDAIREEGVEDEDEEEEEDDEEEQVIIQPRVSSRARQTSAAPSDLAPSETGGKRRAGRPKKSESIGFNLAPDWDPLPAPNLQAQTSQVRSGNNRRSPSNGAKAPSVDGTTIMDNSGNYAPLSNVAEETQPAPPAARPSFFQIVRDRITHEYHNRPRINRRHIWLGAIIFLPLLLTATVLRHILQAEPDVIPKFTGPFHPFDSVKNYSSAAWSSMASLTRGSTKGSDQTGDRFYPWALDNRVKNIETHLQKLSNTQRLHQDTIAKFEQILPAEGLAITKENGKWQIPADFFEALKDLLDGEASGQPNAETPSWDAFIRKNELHMRRIFEETFDSRFQNETATHRNAEQPEVISMLDENFSWLKSHWEDVREEVKALVSHEAHDDVKALVAEAMAEAIHPLPDKEMTLLMASNIVHNTELAEKSMNFFSVALGAAVDPFLTSTTYERPGRTWMQRNWIRGHNIRVGNPPLAALERWDEPGDCWCAAAPPPDPSAASAGAPAGPTTSIDFAHDPFQPPATRVDESPPSASARIIGAHSGGRLYEFFHDLAPGQTAPRAQLAVLMPFTIYPKRVTVEHVPRTAILDIGSAPRKIEIWAEVPDPTERARVSDEAGRIFGQHNERPARTARTDGVGLPEGFVRVGFFTYDVRWPNHVQTFTLNVDLERLGVGVRKVVVRAVSNWGREFTCLYRVRMHGRVVEKREEWITDPYVLEDRYQYW